MELFGYGSLIWNPGLPHLEKQVVRVDGWMRRFWQGSTDHRGVPGAPGRVVTLLRAPQSHCWGVAYRIDSAVWETHLSALDHREKGGYTREHLRGVSRGGEVVQAIAYVAGPDNPDYLGPASEKLIAAQIGRSRGPSGPNWEYLAKLAGALRELGLEDDHVFRLERLLLSGGTASRDP